MEEWETTLLDVAPGQVAEAIPVALRESAEISAIASWLMSDDGRSDPAVSRWINFLAGHHARFRIIEQLFPKVDARRQGMKDQRCIQTNPLEMLVIANYLFILHSYGVAGCVLECGCFKGYSSCCLSIACRHLGYTLVIADSFAGLPTGTHEVGGDNYYQPGDFTGTRAEVERNLRTFGDPTGVELVEGWFAQTLKGWNRPLAVLWLDVDLWSSAIDVLTPCFSATDPRGAIFSHEFSASYIKDGKITCPNEAPGAIAQFMHEHDPDYRSTFATGNLGIVGRRASLGLKSAGLLNEMMPAICSIEAPLRFIAKSRLQRLKAKITRLTGMLPPSDSKS
jgi:hypothetical protein